MEVGGLEAHPPSKPHLLQGSQSGKCQPSQLSIGSSWTKLLPFKQKTNNLMSICSRSIVSNIISGSVSKPKKGGIISLVWELSLPAWWRSPPTNWLFPGYKGSSYFSHIQQLLQAGASLASSFPTWGNWSQRGEITCPVTKSSEKGNPGPTLALLTCGWLLNSSIPLCLSKPHRQKGAHQSNLLLFPPRATALSNLDWGQGMKRTIIWQLEEGSEGTWNSTAACPGPVAKSW